MYAIRSYYATPVKVVGKERAEGITVLIDGKEQTIPADGIFIGLGYVPNSEFLKDSEIELKKGNFVKINENCATNVEGVYACGDVTGGILQVSNAA